VRPGQKLTKADFQKAGEDYQSYIKITADVEIGIIALGGEYHADAEKKLLKAGSRQDNIWGGGVDLKLGLFETKAMVNLRSGRNNSTEILEEAIRVKFLKLAKDALKGYVENK
jgi:hypothetical protein